MGKTEQGFDPPPPHPTHRPAWARTNDPENRGTVHDSSVDAVYSWIARHVGPAMAAHLVVVGVTARRLDGGETARPCRGRHVKTQKKVDTRHV